MVRAVYLFVSLFVWHFALSPALAYAQDNRYLDIGHFDNKDDAMDQARRISRAGGVEVWLMPFHWDKGHEGEGPRYRLIIEDTEDQRLLRHPDIEKPEVFEWNGNIRELESVFSVVGSVAGSVVGKTRPTTEVDPESIKDASRVSGYFVVVASFKEKSMAEARQAALASEFGNVVVLEARVDGQQYYRVALGPASGRSLDKLKQRIVDAGIQDGWLVPHTGSNVDTGSDVEPPVQARGKVEPKEQEQEPSESGYNPARLRRGPAPFPQNP